MMVFVNATGLTSAGRKDIIPDGRELVSDRYLMAQLSKVLNIFDDSHGHPGVGLSSLLSKGLTLKTKFISL